MRLNNLATIYSQLAKIQRTALDIDQRVLAVTQATPSPRDVPALQTLGEQLQAEADRVHATADRLLDLPAMLQLTSGDLL